MENVQTIPPPYVVRTILIYSRPPCQPQFSLTEPMKVSEAWERAGCLLSAGWVVRHLEGLPDHWSCGTFGQVPRVQGRRWGMGGMGAWSALALAQRLVFLPCRKCSSARISSSILFTSTMALMRRRRR